MAKRRNGARLLESTPLVSRLERIEQKIAEHVVWDGEDAPAVRTARWVVAEIEAAMEEAAEVWLSTRAAAELTGWDAQTLARWAKAKLDGETLRGEWRHIQVRKDGHGYAFRVSTLPVKPRYAS